MVTGFTSFVKFSRFGSLSSMVSSTGGENGGRSSANRSTSNEILRSLCNPPSRILRSSSIVSRNSSVAFSASLWRFERYCCRCSFSNCFSCCADTHSRRTCSRCCCLCAASACRCNRADSRASSCIPARNPPRRATIPPATNLHHTCCGYSRSICGSRGTRKCTN